jgi:hypothetical protein
MAYNNINDVINDIKSKQGVTKGLKPIDTSSFLKAPTNKVKVHEFDVPKAALYDRLSDGSYIAKYENYVGAKGNENRLAQKQSATEQIFNGLTKNTAKVFNYAADSIVGTAYGIASGISKGSLSAVFDNDFSNWMDDTNKKLDNSLANYYTDEEKSQHWLKSLGTVNFWANDVAGGLAFVGGALLPDLALAAVTGGGTLGVSAAKFSAKFGLKALAKEGAESLLKTGLRKGAEKLSEKMGAKALKTYTYARLGSKVGTVADNALFLARTSNFEAGMEARQNFKDSVDTFYSTFEEKNGRQPSYEEAKEFIDNARSASNGVYGANLAILSVSNAVMFGKKILPSSLTGKLSNVGNRLIGLGTKAETVAAKEGVGKIVQTSMRGANKIQKIVGKSYNILRKPLTEGLYEEGFQGVAGKTMQNYLEAKYDPQHTDTYSAWSAMHDAFTEQYTSNEGWKEMGIGMIIGFAGGAIQPGTKFKDKFPGFGAQSWGASYKAKESSLERSNKGIEMLASMNRTAAVKAMSDARQSGFKDDLSENFENKLNHYNFIKSQELTSDMSQIRDTHDQTIDNLKIDDEVLTQLKDAGISEDTYKQALKDEFKQNQKDYKMAKSSVEALGLDKKIKDTRGNLAEIGDALTLNIMLGKGALHSAKVVADEIDSVIGTSGIYNHLLHYANLNEKGTDLFDQLVATKSELDILKTNAADQAQELNRLNSEKLPGAKDVDSKYKATSQLAVLTQQKIAKLEQEKEKIQSALQAEFDSNGYNLKDVLGDSATTTVEDVVNNLDKLDSLVSSFRKSGKTKEAAGVEYLMNKFKGFTDSHREMVNMQRNMADTNFFSSKQGKGLISNILGLNYKMSDALKKDIEDNNQLLDESLSLYGRRDYDTVQKKLQSVLEENEQLSDREKFRLESLIRLQLSTGAMEFHKDILTNAYDNLTTDTEEAVDPMEGDTVALKLKEDLKDQDLNNLDILNKAINDITSQLDNILNAAEDNSEEISKLNTELENLKVERDAIKEKQQQKEDSGEQGTNNSNSNQSSQVQKEEIENRRKESLDDITEDENGQFTTPVIGKDGSFTIASDVSREEHIQLINDFYDREIAALGIDEKVDLISTPVADIVTELDKLPTASAKLEWLRANNLLTQIPVQGKNYNAIDYKDRIMVMMKIGKYNIPFYISTGQAGKKNVKAGDWYAVFGIGIEGGWINKGSEDQINSSYNFPIFEKISKILNEGLGTIDSVNEAGKTYEGFAILDSKEEIQVFNDVMNLPTNPAGRYTDVKDFYDHVNSTLSLLSEELNSMANVQQNVPISDTEQEDNLNRLKEIEDRIKEIEDEISNLGDRFKLLETEDFKRYEELLRKKEDGTVTPEETIKLDKLKNNIDQWTMLTGVVVDGFRLSDLLQQKIVLEKTAITEIENVAIPTTEDTIDAVDFADRVNNANYRYGLTYQNAFISYQGSSEDENSTITIHYLTEEAFNGYVKGKVDVPVERDSKNNIVIPAKFIKEINEKTDLRIVPTNQKMSTYYSVLLEVGTDVAGNQILKPIESTFRKEFNNKQGHNIQAAFNTNPGDVVTMSIDPTDDYNKTLIAEYKKAVKAGKDIDEAKTKLKKELLILAKVGGKVVATFKKRSEGNKTQKDLIFEDVRNAIVDNDANIEALLKAKGAIEPKVINKEGKPSVAAITVNQVKFGHPTYNYTMTADGVISIQSKTLSEGQIKAVKDIGYVEGGKTFTRDRKAVDTTYLTKLTSKKSKEKIPFVVLEVGGKRVAYPVSVGYDKISNIDVFESVYNNENITVTEKINKLNKFLAENGIDIKKSGEAFISFGTNNLNDEFFNKKLAELKAINYFYNVEDWINSSNPMEEIVKNQISVDIDVLNPFHSPKLGFDYSKVDLQTVTPVNTSSKKGGSKKKTSKKADPNGKTSALYAC